MKDVFVHVEHGHGRWEKRHRDWPWSYRWTANEAAIVKHWFARGDTADYVKKMFLVSDVELSDLCRSFGIVMRR